MRYTQLSSTAFQEMQLNAGIICDSFTPSTGVIGNIIGATSGGVSFEAVPTFKDFGEDIDNCPKNSMELKQIEEWVAKLTGNFKTVTTAVVKSLLGAADIDSVDTTNITPRNDLAESDFDELWWVGDYSDKNSSTSGGYVAIHMKNTISTGGFKIQSSDKEKGTFAFEYTAHYSIDDPDEVPFEIFVKAGTT